MNLDIYWTLFGSVAGLLLCFSVTGVGILLYYDSFNNILGKL